MAPTSAPFKSSSATSPSPPPRNTPTPPSANSWTSTTNPIPTRKLQRAAQGISSTLLPCSKKEKSRKILSSGPFASLFCVRLKTEPQTELHLTSAVERVAGAVGGEKGSVRRQTSVDP